MPPLAKMMELLTPVWESHCLTNRGPSERKLTELLRQTLHARCLTLVGNGTLGLLVALKALELSGEIITTPFTFAATAHAIAWNGCTPVFGDILPGKYTLDPEKIESLITERTSAILAVHVYGTPCEHEKLAAIARKHHLKLIYDAAHAFDVEEDGEYIVNYGDISVLSFHATKKFHTFEGGAVITSDPRVHEKITRLINFGYDEEASIAEVGINAKLDEFRATVGLCQLENMDFENRRRREVCAFYRHALAGIHGISLCLELPGVTNNNGYFPIFVGTEYRMSRDELQACLGKENIIARKYFYPLLSNIGVYRGHPSAAPDELPVANRVAASVLCLPLHSFLEPADLNRIVSVIRGNS